MINTKTNQSINAYFQNTELVLQYIFIVTKLILFFPLVLIFFFFTN